MIPEKTFKKWMKESEWQERQEKRQTEGKDHTSENLEKGLTK